MDVIDLRSDTVTHPTPEMREAMHNAVVGDDVFGDDPTVNQLEREAAEKFGLEAGLLVSSGTQGNLIALMAHCQRGDEVILGDRAHIAVYEQGSIAQIGGIMPRTIPVQDDGTLCLDDIENAIRMDNDHFPRSRVVAVENTHNTAGGVPLSADYMRALAEVTRKHDLKLHIDGARIFNAAAAYQVPVSELVQGADSVTFCLSKGLCAPVGSVLMGRAGFIKKARRIRKVLGSGMRQAGVIAAPGLVALHKMSRRLHEDHENATYLAQGLSEIPCIEIKKQNTNFIFFRLRDDAPLNAHELVERLLAYNIKSAAYPSMENAFRFVTHYWITRERIDYVIETMRDLLT